MEFLSLRIQRQEWDLVAQLALQRRARDATGAGDEMIKYLVDDAHAIGHTVPARVSLLSFAARTLRFVFPHRRVTRMTADAVLRFALDYEVTGTDLMRLLGSLVQAAPENAPSVMEAGESVLAEAFDGANPGRCVRAVELLGVLPTVAAEAESRLESGMLDEWKDWTCRLMVAHADAVRRAMARSYWAGRFGFSYGAVSVREFMGLRGTSELFEVATLNLLPNWSYGSVAQVLILAALEGPPSPGVADGLNDVGQALTASPLPWLCPQPQALVDYVWGAILKTRADHHTSDPNALFSLFVLAAAFLDAASPESTQEVLGSVQAHPACLPPAVRSLLLSRRSSAASRNESLMDLTAWTETQREFAISWVDERILLAG